MKNKHSLSKKEIIRGKKPFERILKSGKRFVSGYLKIFVCYSGERRAGFAVSSKVGKAVVRNKIKRWLREIYRKEKFALKDRTEIIMLIDGFDEKINYNTLKEDVLTIFREINENI